MIVLQSLGSRVAEAVTKPHSAPTGEEDTWSDLAFKENDANSKAQNDLFSALNEDDPTWFTHCKSAYEIWQHLLVTYEGTSQVKRAKIDLLRSQYESFKMHENESIDDMITKFTKIINGLASLGDEINNDQKVRKVMRALPPPWEVKAVSYTHLTLPTIYSV